MFEGLVHQLLVGYLGKYVKNIQKEQLRIGLWKGEVLLENVELVSEAFDYLQLPFAIKKGVIGKLSIKIPWKKFGWDPILIALEDVFICTCQRDDAEWGAEAVQAREWAGKRAQLAAAELAKLSKRVCDDQAGQTLISNLPAKIIDNIQVTIKNVHIRYIDQNPDSKVSFSFGLIFSTLTIMTADARAFSSSARTSAAGKSKGGQVHKLVEIHDMGLYWNSNEKYSKDISLGNRDGVDLFSNLPPDNGEFNYILKPLSATLSLMVSRSGKFGSGSPQYAVALDLNDLVLTLDDIQIYQMLVLWNDVSICRLREKYGRFRPWNLPALHRTGVGWKRHWWQYAINAVLADVCKKMRRVSWKYFELRMATRRKYIMLYRLKLEYLQQDQPLDDDSLHELEELEKELDMDEILNYRSIAESRLQIEGMPLKTNSLELEPVSKGTGLEKQQIDERVASKPGWLNWLSLGMLGAGGTTDSNQFAGIISYDIIKDIYEATTYNPVSILDSETVSKSHCYLSLSIDAQRVIVNLNSMSKKTSIICMTLCGANMSSNFWQDSARFSIIFNSMKVVDPCTNRLPFSYILQDKVSLCSDDFMLSEVDSGNSYVQFLTIEVEILPQGSDVDLSVKVMVHPLKFVYYADVLENIIDFLELPTSFQSHLDLVLSSLNGFDNIEARVVSKAKYIFSNRKRVSIEASFQNIDFVFPWCNGESSWSKMVFFVESMHFGLAVRESAGTEKYEVDKLHALAKKLALHSVVEQEDDLAMLATFYDNFDIQICGVQAKLESPRILSDICFMEFEASATIDMCILQDEPTMSQLKVRGDLPSIHVFLSSTILKVLKDINISYSSEHSDYKNKHVKAFPERKSMLHNCKMPESFSFNVDSSCNSRPASPLKSQISASDTYKVVRYEASLEFKSGFVKLSFDDGDHYQEKFALHAQIENINAECTQGGSGCNIRIGIEKIKIDSLPMKGNLLCSVLCTKKFESAGSTVFKTDENFDFNVSNAYGYKAFKSGSERKCFYLHYNQRWQNGFLEHRTKIYLNNLEYHFQPKLIGMLHRFLTLVAHERSSSTMNTMDSSLMQEIRKKERTQQWGSKIKNADLDMSSLRLETISDALGMSVEQFPFIHFEYARMTQFSDKPGMTASSSHKRNESAFDNSSKSEDTPASTKLSQDNEIVSLGIAEVKEMHADSDKTDVFGKYEIQIELEVNSSDIHFYDSACTLATLLVNKSKCFILLSDKHDCYDIMGSFEDIKLLSAWASSCGDILWGPLVQHPCPILNLRLRKNVPISGYPELELSISIQHVRCLVPSDFLAVMIGYFTFDWEPNLGEESNIWGRKEDSELENTDFCFLYKVEVTDSVLILSVETNCNEVLEIGLPYLFFSFLPSCTNPSKDINKDNEGVSVANFGTAGLDSINVDSRQLSLSFAVVKNGEQDANSKDKCDANSDLPLIEGVDAALSVRIPRVSQVSSEPALAPISIIFNAQSLVANILENSFLRGLQVFENVAFELSSLGTNSQLFRASVTESMKSRLEFKHSNTGVSKVSNKTSIDIKCVMSKLSMKLHSSRGNVPGVLDLIGKVDAEQIEVSCFWRNDSFETLAVQMFSTRLISSINSLTLLECLSTDSSHPGIGVHLSTLPMSHYEGTLSVICTHLWVHLTAWNEIAIFASTCINSQARIIQDASSKSSDVGFADIGELKDATELHSERLDGNEIGYSGGLHLKSETLNISFHIPDYSSGGEAAASSRNIGNQRGLYEDYSSIRLDDMEKNYVESEIHVQRFVLFSLSAVLDELIVSDLEWVFKARIMQIEGKTQALRKHIPYCLPFCHIADIGIKGKICDKSLEPLKIVLDIEINKMDIWSSYPVLCFWYNFKFGNIIKASSTSLDFKLDVGVCVQKAAFLLSDGRWSCNAPIMEIFIRHISFCANWINGTMEASFSSELQINYHNIHKVAWEPFLEPWSMQCHFIRRLGRDGLLNTSPETIIDIKSSSKLNLNLTEALIQAAVRGLEMIKDVRVGIRSDESPGNYHSEEYSPLSNTHIRRYAPYFLQNDTGMPLHFWLIHGPIIAENNETLNGAVRSAVEPGVSVPLFVEETTEELLRRWRPNHSSERFVNRKASGTKHHMICIQLEGTSRASMPMSMDLVGLRSFEVDFSKNSGTGKTHEEEDHSLETSMQEENAINIDLNSTFIVPVIFEVSIQRYSKLVRLYSTVTFVNATPVSLEVCFDIPFGIAPKVMDPILPGQELPLPMHLAKTGRMRWRPLGSSYLWSEAQSLSNILSQENKLGLSRSFVCYPSHPSNGPFRCCISVQENAVPCNDCVKQSSLDFQEQSDGKHLNSTGLTGITFSSKKTNTISIRRITLTAPLVVKNCLPVCLEFLVENGASIMERVFVSEGDAVSVFDIDFVRDLSIEFHVGGFSPSLMKFARATVYTTEIGTSNSQAEKIVLTETLILSPDSCKGPPVFVKVEKTVDPLRGSRELSLSVPFWIYNCSDLILEAMDSEMDHKSGQRILYPCYSSIKQEEITNQKYGIGIACVDLQSTVGAKHGNTISKGICYPNHHKPCKIRSHLPCQRAVSWSYRSSENNSVWSSSASPFNGNHEWQRRERSMSFSDYNDVSGEAGGRRVDQIPKPQACMHSPAKGFQVAEPTLRLRMGQSKYVENLTEGPLWSDPFSLNPPSGSSMVLIPQPCTSGAFIISAISTPVLGACAGRTMAVTIQPRYVISNACSRDLFYKQSGTNSYQRLRVGEHFNLYWTDVKRELLLSIRFDELGWDWSGSFLPDKLGDTQVKIRNYETGALQMVRIEVQNANHAVGETKSVSNSNASLATYLVLLSDDDTGFMPYRIDNFSMERLRFYQPKCEQFENFLQPYTSCSYAWDEPCHPDQLTIEVPGKGALGSYALDDVREHMPVHLATTSEKSERRFLVSVHAEGPIKVLSITNADTHIIESLNGKGSYRFGEKHKTEQSGENYMEFSENITVCLPFIGLAMVDSVPQELAFASARGIKMKILQGLHRQKIVLQVASFQIDNQLSHPIYPVMVSIDSASSGALAIQGKIKENSLDSKFEEVAVDDYNVSYNAAFCLSVVKWRHMATSVNCFECVSVRFAPLRLEFEDQMVFRLVDFIKSVTWRFWRGTIQAQNFEMWPLNYGMDQTNDHFGDPRNVEFIKNPHSSQLHFLKVMKIMESYRSWPSPAAVGPIGAPWQKISLLAKRRKKIYIEIFQVAPIKLTVSFSSSPWSLKDDRTAAAQSLIWISSTTLQRGLMALMDVEGAPIYFRELTLAHPLASWDAIQGMVLRHYARQLLHEVYKVLGSVGVFGDPMGFARSLGFGIRDFISVPAKSIVQNPTGIATSMAQGTKSLLNNTVFALSNAATQFSKAARKGVAAFAFDEDFVEEMERRHHGQGYHNQGVLNEFLEGLTGLLQSPIRGAEKHGLPGILLGIAGGVAGFVARPVVSILEVSGKTAQSIRNRYNPCHLNHFRVRLPRPVIRDSPLHPYSWEEAVGTAMLQEVESNQLKNEVLVTCIALDLPGMFVIVTERLLLKVKSASLAAAALSQNTIPAGPEWNIHLEIALDDIIHYDREGRLLNVLACTPETHFRKLNDSRVSKQNYMACFLPFTQQSIELPNEDVTEELLHLLHSLIDELKEHPSRRIFRQHNLR